jgi:carbon-monoxide dehydrogenase small subunit|tara:strand:- start:7924 stop:8217 length:294 start_codon:yes stop_codon:yes gene_type:complete
VLAVEVDGAIIETIEGLSDGLELHPLQSAFLQETALQCGYCTPGLIMAAKDLLSHEPNPSESRIRHWLANNLCRCTGYDRIIKAVKKAGETIAASHE